MALIREMNRNERPREKAKRYGVKSLSAAELLAILMRSGVKGTNALELAESLLQASGDLCGVAKMNFAEMKKIRGISDVKALELLACFELSRRIAYETAVEKNVIRDPESLLEWLYREIGSSQQERFLAVYLNTANHIIDYQVLFVGTINEAGVYPREVFKQALLLNSTNLMLVHNHPSGNLRPSRNDINLTREFVQIGRLMNIRILDHLIVSNSDFFSFAANGLLNDMESNEK